MNDLTIAQYVHQLVQSINESDLAHSYVSVVATEAYPGFMLKVGNRSAQFDLAGKVVETERSTQSRAVSEEEYGRFLDKAVGNLQSLWVAVGGEDFSDSDEVSDHLRSFIDEFFEERRRWEDGEKT